MDDTPLPPQPTSPRLLVVMFTDLVNSTSLKEKLGPANYRKLKGVHDRFIREALTIAPSGAALQDTGDGYFLSFGSVAQAVSAALLFQWLMAKEPWEHPFRARVGLHIGEVDESRSEVTGRADFVSSAIDVASRAMSLAEGGQIILTRSVFDAARQIVRTHPARSPDGSAMEVVWLSHGNYQFKGCADPVEIFEVGVKGVSPLRPPADSEKAIRVVESDGSAGMESVGKTHPSQEPVAYGRLAKPLITRRSVLIAILAGSPIVIGAGIWAWSQRSDPLAEMRRLQIERKVARLKAEPYAPPKSADAGIRQVDRIVTGENAAFEIIADNRVVDLRGWKEVPQERMSELYSHVTITRRLQLKKTSPVTWFEFEARTSGLDVVLSCDEPFPCVYEAQRGDAITGVERMRVRKMSVDVSSIEVGREFTLHLVCTYWNSLQTEAEQWLGVMGYKRSFEASQLILFPANMPFKSYSLKVSRTVKETPTDFSGKRVVLSGESHDWLYWEILNPEPEHVYRLYWKW